MKKILLALLFGAIACPDINAMQQGCIPLQNANQQIDKNFIDNIIHECRKMAEKNQHYSSEITLTNLKFGRRTDEHFSRIVYNKYIFIFAIKNALKKYPSLEHNDYFKEILKKIFVNEQERLFQKNCSSSLGSIQEGYLVATLEKTYENMTPKIRGIYSTIIDFYQYVLLIK